MYENYLYTPSFSNEFQEYIAEFVDDVEHLNVGKRAIEIGSSNGYLLKKMQDKGWDHTDIDYIIDINKNYWWKYISGGGNIQIVPPTWLEEHYVDSIIIMATGYSNEIIAENNDYLKRGGRFIKMIDNN